MIVTEAERSGIQEVKKRTPQTREREPSWGGIEGGVKETPVSGLWKQADRVLFPEMEIAGGRPPRGAGCVGSERLRP